MSRVLVVMGVSGVGKTTIAQRLAAALGWMFQEGDALHPAENVAKMKAGHALTDADRIPWLAIIAEWVDARLHTGTNGIITCSALKRSYRQLIGEDKAGVRFVYLRADRATLESQLATLEAPTPDEHAIIVDVTGPEDRTVAEVIRQLNL